MNVFYRNQSSECLIKNNAANDFNLILFNEKILSGFKESRVYENSKTLNATAHLHLSFAA